MFKVNNKDTRTTLLAGKCRLGYGECVRHLAVRSGGSKSLLTNERVQPKKDSDIYHHLLNCNYLPTFVDFSVLFHENKKFLLQLKESLLRPSMNRNIRSVPLYLFE